MVCFLACTTLKTKLGYDDSLDAFGVHGVGGTLGALLTGVFATKIVGGGAVPLGLIEEMKSGAATTAMDQPGILAQAVAAVITWVFAAVVTFVILKVLDVAMGLARVATRRDPGPGPQPAWRGRLHIHLISTPHSILEGDFGRAAPASRRADRCGLFRS